MPRYLEFLIASLIIFLLLPLFFLIAIVVIIFDGNPFLFRQKRVGKNKKNFYIFKFRTMKKDKTLIPLTTLNDQRITKVGMFLRRYKLDELPQLFNVLKGEMSFVGPRPEVPKFVNNYTKKQKNIIFSVRPGITDPASLLFKNENKLLSNKDNPEEIYLKEILPKKLSVSSNYIKNKGTLSDFILIFKTIFSLFNL